MQPSLCSHAMFAAWLKRMTLEAPGKRGSYGKLTDGEGEKRIRSTANIGPEAYGNVSLRDMCSNAMQKETQSLSYYVTSFDWFKQLIYEETMLIR